LRGSPHPREGEPQVARCAHPDGPDPRRPAVIASVAKSNHGKYTKSASPTDYVEFEDRPHLFMAGEGWEEVAEAIDRWLSRTLTTA